jgi:antitoxin PrlF
LATAKLTSKGQVTIPVKVRADLGVEAGDRLEFVKQENGQYSIVPATRSVRDLRGMLRVKSGKAVSIEEMNKVIAERASGSR